MQDMVHKVMKIIHTDFTNFFFCFLFLIYKFKVYFNKDRVMKITPQPVQCNEPINNSSRH